MNENELIKELMNKYFINVGHDNYLELYEHLFDSVVGQLKTREKRWVVDIDTKDVEQLNAVKFAINKYCNPSGDKVEAVIPTKNGYHLITDRFDVLEFKKHFPEIDIQKKNPSVLYIPDERNT